MISMNGLRHPCCEEICGMNRLALGTVQFGLPYGIANNTGQVNRVTASAIINRAYDAGFDTLDTAIAYGDSEQCLGEIGVDNWRVVTKLPEVPVECANILHWVEEQVQGSLRRLRVKSLAGLLLHRPSQLLEDRGDDLWIALHQLKSDGIVEKVGFSIYAPEELDTLWDSFSPDLVQAPYNIFDRRLETTGWLDRLYNSAVEVHVRSIFLQGLLLIDESIRSAMFNRWKKVWNKWEEWLHSKNLNPLLACLSYALSEQRIDRIVVGVESVEQINELIVLKDCLYTGSFPDFKVNDLDLLNPSKWLK